MRIKELFLNDVEILNKYRCVVNGNQIVAIDCNKKPMLRKCLSFAKKGFYTELWYCYNNGTNVLVNFWN